jgi:hypothetical protein
MTALAAALKDKGFTSIRERLDALAEEAFAAHPRTNDQAQEYILRAVRNDAAMLFVMFERWHGVCTGMLLQAAAKRIRERRQQRATAKEIGGDGRNYRERREPIARAADPTPAEREKYRGSVARIISKLDTVRIDGTPIGRCTPEKAVAWADGRRREARFVYLVSAGVPPGREIGEFVTPDEANAAWERAQREIGNE